MRTPLIVVCLVLAVPAAAQTRIGSVRESPFVPGTSRIYDTRGAFIGTARENAFIPGRVDLYGPTGRSTGIQVRDSAFDADRRDIFDATSETGDE